MDIKRIFSTLGRRQETNVIHTPYGSFNLAKEDDRKRMKHVVMTLQQTTDALTRKDIADWRRAWQLAIDIQNPNRQRLYDIYRDAEVDAHLSGCVRQRQGFVMAKTFKIVDAKENENKEALHFFDQSWFKQLCRLVLDSVGWGHSLIELGDIVQDGNGCACYSGVRLIPRKHVIPEYGRVVSDLGQSWNTGIDYHQPPFSDWLIEAGQPDNLGLFLKAAQHTIPKKNMLAFWDTFGEIFGMPMRIAKTASRDSKEINRLNRMLVEAGASQTAVMPLDTELEFIESTRGDAYNVYNQRVDRANSELSKLIIGQTMTIEDGSSLSQSQTHLQVFQNLVEEDADMLRDVINNQLLPRMVAHGFPLKGFRFDWDYSVDFTPEQQVAYETMVADRYEVDPSYFAEKYSMPVGERRNNMSMMEMQDPDDKSHTNEKNETRSDSQVQPQNTDDQKGKSDGKKQEQKNVHHFFAQAPQDGAHLDW